MRRLVKLLLVLPILATAGPVEDSPREGDLPRFRVLADGLYRGGQPTEKGFQFLKEKGVKTIINFRAEDDSEAAIVERLGIRYVRISAWRRSRRCVCRPLSNGYTGLDRSKSL